MTEAVIGTVSSCRRYPVKSMQGLEVGALDIRATGVDGDRAHGLVDPASGHLLSAKRTAVLLQVSATDDAITLPDGAMLTLEDPRVDEALSAWLGKNETFPNHFGMYCSVATPGRVTLGDPASPERHG